VLLPKWFHLPGVLTWVSEDGDANTGYVMLAFFREGDALVGDVLAIAVRPEFQGRGIGRMLLQHAVQICEETAEHSPVVGVRLSVAATNDRARHLFETSGFHEVDGDFGSYEGGQKALHMRRPINPAPLERR
jgi:ribosomal protein S18 acetylase RimI-like enzyme